MRRNPSMSWLARGSPKKKKRVETKILHHSSIRVFLVPNLHIVPKRSWSLGEDTKDRTLAFATHAKMCAGANTGTNSTSIGPLGRTSDRPTIPSKDQVWAPLQPHIHDGPKPVASVRALRTGFCLAAFGLPSLDPWRACLVTACTCTVFLCPGGCSLAALLTRAEMIIARWIRSI